MVKCGPDLDWTNVEVWVGLAGTWEMSPDLTDEDRAWVRGQLRLAGSRRSSTSAVAAMEWGSVDLNPDPRLAQKVWS